MWSAVGRSHGNILSQERSEPWKSIVKKNAISFCSSSEQVLLLNFKMIQFCCLSSETLTKCREVLHLASSLWGNLWNMNLKQLSVFNCCCCSCCQIVIIIIFIIKLSLLLCCGGLLFLSISRPLFTPEKRLDYRVAWWLVITKNEKTCENRDVSKISKVEVFWIPPFRIGGSKWNFGGLIN